MNTNFTTTKRSFNSGDKFSVKHTSKSNAKNFSLHKVFGLALIFIITSIVNNHKVYGQMTGTYTINSVNAASATNFKNWQSFWQSLQGLTRSDLGFKHNGGISGPVTLNVQSTLTETVAVQMPTLAASSSTNTITINGGNNTVSYAGTSTAPAVFALNGTDFLRISNLVIRNTGAITNAMGVRFFGGADNNIIQNCTLEFSGITIGSTTAGGAYVAFTSSTSITGVTSGIASNGSFNTIQNNIMRTTNLNSPGPAYGIFEIQNTANYTTTHSNNTFEGNTISNFFFYGISTYYTNGTRIIKNDISRASVSAGNPSTTSGGINSYYNYATNRSISAEGNFIHDLPFLGSSAATSNTSMHGMYIWYWYGTTTNPFSIKSNRVINITAASASQAINEGYSTNGNIEENRVENIRTNLNSNIFSIYSIWGSAKNILKNSIVNNRPFGNYYGIYTSSIGGSVANRMMDNIIRDNVSTAPTTYHQMWGIYNLNGIWNVQRNLIFNLNQITTMGYVYGIWSQINGANHLIANNTISNCGGAYATYGFYHNTVANKLTFRQNTINLNTIGGGYSTHYSYGIYGLGNGNTNIEGNIVSCSNTFCAFPMYYGGTTTNGPTFFNNFYWASNFSIQNWYNPLMGTKTAFSDWKSSNLGQMGDEAFGNPKFKNPAAVDFTPESFLTQNNVSEDNQVTVDFLNVNRNIKKCDRGSVRNFMDLQCTAVQYTGGKFPCTGYSEKLKISVRNTYVDSARDFNVSFSLNGQIVSSEKVNFAIGSGQTGTFEFQTPVKFSNSGNYRLAVYIDMPDDKTSNDSQIFNITVKKAPGGSILSSAPTSSKAIYQVIQPFDVTILNNEVSYSLTAPAKFTNTGYNTTWNAQAFVVSANGKYRPNSELTLTAPGTGDLKVTWKTSDKSLEDTFVFVSVKFFDLVNGCDTVVNRKVLVYPSIAPDFKFPTKICDQEQVLFENKSAVKSGFMQFKWDFGTGNTEDTSNSPEPQFIFPTDGNYKVVLEAKTYPYGFAFYDTSVVVISQTPKALFGRQNACYGDNIVLTNKTVPLTSEFSWEFGDGTTSKVESPTKKYAASGAYMVKLTAKLNGCVKVISQPVYQFEKPEANFTHTSGICQNDVMSFENKTKIFSNSYGTLWSFSDGNLSTELNPKHKFDTDGDKIVKLVAISEFGCKDSISKKVTIAKVAKPEFDLEQICFGMPTQTINNTKEVVGAVATYTWSFENAGTSNAKSPKVTWNNLGKQKVMLKVNLSNGCESILEKFVNVGTKPSANFYESNLCAGSQVNFANKTTFPQGEVSYLWRFSDGTTSTDVNPKKMFTQNGGGNSYFVSLLAKIKNGCTDSISKQITINPGPTTCDFAAQSDYKSSYHSMKFSPVDGNGKIVAQPGVSYTWSIDKNGVRTSDSAIAYFPYDGTYSVTMRAEMKGTGCSCSKTKEVQMSRSSISDIESMLGNVYPNPSNGVINIDLKDKLKADGKAEIFNLAGVLVSSYKLSGQNNVIEASDIANGIYILKITTNGKIQNHKIQINK